MRNLYSLFLNHWERKLISLFLAIVIWFVVNYSQTITKTLENIPVRLNNISPGMIVEDLQSDGLLSKKINLSIQGNKALINEIAASNLEIVLDATDKSGEWDAIISKKNLYSSNHNLDLSRAIKRVVNQTMKIQFKRLMTEKIPITVQPMGEPAADYQFLDIWPKQLTLSVTGPEEIVKQLQSEGCSLPLHLNNISLEDLERLDPTSDRISFIVPESWKKVLIPSLSDKPFMIDDGQELRIDFVRDDFLPFENAIPLNLFFSTNFRLSSDRGIYSFFQSGIVKQFHGLYFLHKRLYTRGVPRAFVEQVKDMIEISILVGCKNEKKFLDWSIQILNPRVLEDRFVTAAMDAETKTSNLAVLKEREEYHRNRFRHYMNLLQFYTEDKKKLDLKIELVDYQIIVHENDSGS